MELLTYTLENRGDTPAYMYIYECIRDDILAGRIKPGERLPSKRPLAAHLGVAIITVENAYAQLITEGYIQSYEKKGYYVSEDMEIIKSSADVYENAEGIGYAGLDGRTNGEAAAVLTKDKEMNLTEIAVDFSVNSIKSDTFPFDSWSRLMRRCMLDHEAGFLTAPEGQGVYELRKAIAEYLFKSKGMYVDAGKIIIGPGTEYLHHILIQLIGRSCLVAVENPGYKKVGQIYETNGVKVIHVPVDGRGMIIDRLKDSNVKLVHISPAHHFPTGLVMPAHRRGRLLRWAAEQGAYVIEDDYDSEFRFEGRPLTTLYTMDSSNVIYMNTFTKTLAPSIRVAYMILPDALYEKYRTKLSFYSGTVSGFEQYTLAAFISEGYYERHIRRVRNRYKKCRLDMREALEKSGLLENITINEDKAGLQLSFEVNPEYASKSGSLVGELLKKGIRIVPFTDYCYGDNELCSGHFLLYYSDIDKAAMTEAFRTMKLLLEN